MYRKNSKKKIGGISEERLMKQSMHIFFWRIIWEISGRILGRIFRKTSRINFTNEFSQFFVWRICEKNKETIL